MLSHQQEKNHNQYSEQFDAELQHLANRLMQLPYEVREPFIESLARQLLNIVPMSGMTIQQHIPATQETLNQLNAVLKEKDTFKNSPSARYVYQFAREATSAGVIPVYRDQKTGELYSALICNKRNVTMYNWSAGYTEAPLPAWQGPLLSETSQSLYFSRYKIKESATNTMHKLLDEARGNWTKVNYDSSRFAEGFKADGIDLPKIDLNALHTAMRECLEELHLDLQQFPDRKTFLISTDNTVGISQGDAPGQLSNRSHQYMVYLGELEHAPEIKPGDDVAIADWIKVSDIVRESPTQYRVNNKLLCEYMLRGLECGLKQLWDYLLAQTSTFKSDITLTPVCKFSSVENLVAEIETILHRYRVDSIYDMLSLARFTNYLINELPDKTYTGKRAEQVLMIALKAASYLIADKSQPGTEIIELNKLAANIPYVPKLYQLSSFSQPASIGGSNIADYAKEQQSILRFGSSS